MRAIFFFLTIGTGFCFNVTIYHTNDLHCKWNGIDANGGSIQDYKLANYGGYIRLKATLDAEKARCIAKKESFLNLNAGGTFDGSIEFIITGAEDPIKAGQLIGKFMHNLSLDAMSLSVHEFDLGNEGLNAFLKKAGTNRDQSKIYLVDDDADCYDNEEHFLRNTLSTRKEIDFQQLHPTHTKVEMPICVCANFLNATYHSSACFSTWLPRMKRSVVRLLKKPDGTVVPVGIIGYISPDVKYMRRERFNEIDKTKVVFGDPVKYVQHESERLHSMGVNIIIALGTAKLEYEKEIASLPFITAVISGQKYDSYMYNPNTEPECNPKHEIPSYPTLLPKLVEGAIVGFTPFAQVYPHGKHLGKLQLKFNDQGKLPLNEETNDFFTLPTYGDDKQNPIVLNGQLKETPQGLILSNPNNSSQNLLVSLDEYKKMETLLQEWKTEFETHVSKMVIMHPKPYIMLDKYIEGGEACRQRECKLGGIIADSHLKWYSTIKNELPPDSELFPEPLGIICSNNIRGHLGDVFTSANSKKAVHTYDVIEILSAGHKVVVVRLTQQQLLDMFKWSISQWDNQHPSGRLLQVSHNVRVTFKFGTLNPFSIGENEIQLPAVKVEILSGTSYVDIGQENYKNKLFDIVTTKYLANGKSEYSMVKEGETFLKEECPWKVMETYLKELDLKIYRHRLQFYK